MSARVGKSKHHTEHMRTTGAHIVAVQHLIILSVTPSTTVASYVPLVLPEALLQCTPYQFQRK